MPSLPRPKYAPAADPLVPESSAFVFNVVIERTKRRKSPDTEQIPAELIKQTVGQFVLRSVNLHNTNTNTQLFRITKFVGLLSNKCVIMRGKKMQNSINY